MASYFTTRTGDTGSTRLISGERVSKSHPAVVATGSLDSVRAELAEARLLLQQSGRADAEEHAAFLFWLLHVCFLIGTQVNDPECRKPEYRVESVGETHLNKLESEQSRIEAQLTLPRSFIVTASNPLAARLDVIATHARAMERDIVLLSESSPAFEATELLRFTNRLSDYLVALARLVDDGQYVPVDYSVLKG